MKTVKLIFCLLMLCAVQTFADNLTPAQEKAQRALYAFLQKAKYDPSVDTSDNSVCFRRNGVLYWVNFNEESPILYTFHRNGFKVGTDSNTYERTPAIVAANEVNSKHKTVKLSVLPKKVDIAIQVYASTPEEFTAVFNSYFKCFDNVYDDFRKAYKTALEEQKENEQRMEQKIEEEAQKYISPSDLRGKVKNIAFRLVDANGNETTAYDQPLRSYNARFLQTRLEFYPWQEDDDQFTIHIRIFGPNGKTVYPRGKDFSSESTFTLRKSKKTQTVEVGKIGADKQGAWKAGEYKVEVTEGGDVIYTTTFNML